MQDDEYRKNAMTREQAVAHLKTADAVAYGFGFAFLAGSCGIAYWIWPEGITDLTLAAITFGQLLRAIGSLFSVVVGLVLAAMICH